MRYYVDGDERFQRFESLEEAIQAAKCAPWSNGKVYDADGTTGGYFLPEQTFQLLFSTEQEEM